MFLAKSSKHQRENESIEKSKMSQVSDLVTTSMAVLLTNSLLWSELDDRHCVLAGVSKHKVGSLSAVQDNADRTDWFVCSFTCSLFKLVPCNCPPPTKHMNGTSKYTIKQTKT